MSIGDALAQIGDIDIPFSRIPVYAGNPEDDNFVGYVLKSDIQQRYDQHGGTLVDTACALLAISDERADVRRTLGVSRAITLAGTPLPQAFDGMLSRREHIALAVSCEGRLTGVVSWRTLSRRCSASTSSCGG